MWNNGLQRRSLKKDQKWSSSSENSFPGVKDYVHIILYCQKNLRKKNSIDSDDSHFKGIVTGDFGSLFDLYE